MMIANKFKVSRLVVTSAVTALTLGMATVALAENMFGSGHLEHRSIACIGPIEVDGSNGGVLVQGSTTPNAGEFTLIQDTDTRFLNPVTVVDLVGTQLSQFVSVADHPELFPGFFKLCVATTRNGNNGTFDYSLTIESGPF